jgi:hypothetical protein
MIGGIFMGIHQMRHESHFAYGGHWKERVADVCVKATYRTLQHEKSAAHPQNIPPEASSSKP